MRSTYQPRYQQRNQHLHIEERIPCIFQKGQVTHLVALLARGKPVRLSSFEVKEIRQTFVVRLLQPSLGRLERPPFWLRGR